MPLRVRANVSIGVPVLPDDLNDKVGAPKIGCRCSTWTGTIDLTPRSGESIEDDKSTFGFDRPEPTLVVIPPARALGLAPVSTDLDLSWLIVIYVTTTARSALIVSY